MNRRVLAALLALADVHEMKETDGVSDEQSDATGGMFGVALNSFREDTDDSAFYRIVHILCAAAETIHSDPEGAALLEQARKRELPTRVT